MMRGASRSALDRDDVTIDRRRGPLIQPQLLQAVSLTQLERREVQESELDRLAELVCVLPGQQHGRDMRVDAFNACDRLRKGGVVLRQMRHQRIMSLE